MLAPSTGLLSPPTGKIAVAGDWHGDTRYALVSIAKAHALGVSTIIHVGDIGFFVDENHGITMSYERGGRGGWSEPKNFREQVQAALADAGMTLLFVRGNHDWPENEYSALPRDGVPGATWGLVGDNIAELPRGLRWVWEGVQFLALGGAASIDKWHKQPLGAWWDGEQVTVLEAEQVTADGSADVVIAHDAPGNSVPGLDWEPNWDAVQRQWWKPEDTKRVFDGFKDGYAAGRKHRELLAGVLRSVQPAVWFHGHYHRAMQRTVAWHEAETLVVGLADNRNRLESSLIVADHVHQLADPMHRWFDESHYRVELGPETLDGGV